MSAYRWLASAHMAVPWSLLHAASHHVHTRSRRNTIVCDNLEEGQHWAFRASERHKVALTDGTLFAKSGFMTGGQNASMDDRARSFNQQAVTDLQEVGTTCLM